MFKIKQEKGEAALTWATILICSFAAFGGIMFGYDSGYISGILGMPAFKKQFGHPGWPAFNTDAYHGYLYDSWQKSVVISILSAGTFVGACLSGYAADWIGRKTTTILGCVIYVIGVIIQTLAPKIPVLIVGRAIAGLGVGFESATVIMYISEITPKSIRGTVTSAYQFAITIGLFLAAVVSYCTKDREDSGAFRIPIGLQFLWAIILATGLWFSPESPRWYIMKDKDEEAKKAISRIRRQPVDSEFVQRECRDLTEIWKVERELSAGWIACFSGGFKSGSNLHRTLIGITIQMMQQLTGVNFIFYFGTTFFQSIGLKSPFLVSIITSSVNVVSTPVSFWTMDRFGRRIVLLVGAIGMCICEAIVAGVGCGLGLDNHIAQIVLVTFVCIYIFFFASTWGPGGWVVCGEIFPLQIRAKGVALSTASNWLWNFIIAFVTPYLVDPAKADIGINVFWIWTGTCCVCIAFTYLFVYETKQLSLEQVDQMMQETTARQSVNWQKQNKIRNDIELEEQETGVFSTGKNAQSTQRTDSSTSSNKVGEEQEEHFAPKGSEAV